MDTTQVTDAASAATGQSAAPQPLGPDASPEQLFAQIAHGAQAQVAQEAPDTTTPEAAAPAAGAAPEVAAPPVGAAPEAAAEPELAAHAPSTTPPPATLPPEIQERLRRAEELERLWREAEYARAEAQRQQAQQQLFQTIRDRFTQAYTMAQSLPQDEANAYMARSVEALTQELAAGLNQLMQQQQQQLQDVVRVVAAPAYAHHVARQYGLPQDAVDELQKFAPEEMEKAAQAIKRRLDEKAELLKQIQAIRAEVEQLRRGQVAQQVAASGAHTGGGTNAVPVQPGGDYEPGSLEHLASLLPAGYLGR